MSIPVTIPVTHHRFTVADYYRMVEAGILHEDDRVELIEGEVIDMAPIGSRHAWCVANLTILFVNGLGERTMVWPQNPLHLSDYSEPQPDLSLLRQRPDPRAPSNPAPDNVLLAVEVADSSLRYDRDVKVALYARSGILEVWLVDLTHESISIYREPATDGYRTHVEVTGSEPFSPQAFPDFALTPDQVFGRAA